MRKFSSIQLIFMVFILFGSILNLFGQYDAQINSIYTSPSGTIYEGDTKTIYSNITNLSDPDGPYGGACTFHIRFRVYNLDTFTSNDYWATQSFSNGQTITVSGSSFTFDPSGRYAIGVDVMNVPEDTTYDSDEIYFTVEGPQKCDLHVVDIWTVPANPVAGEEVDLHCEIENIGDVTSESYSIQYKIGSIVVGTDSASPLAVGSNDDSEYYSNYTFTSSGSFSYQVTVYDCSNESYTINNSKLETVNVSEPPPPDIDVINIWTEPSTPIAGEICNLYVQVTNVGEGDAENIYFRYYIDGSQVGTDIDSYLSSGGTQTESMSYTFPISGDYIFKLSVDQCDGETATVNNSETITVSVGEVSIDNNNIIKTTSLHQNYPNPFNPETTISFDLAERSNVAINVYNSKGELVRNLLNKQHEMGSYSVVWNGKNDQRAKVDTGMYYVKLETDDSSHMVKALLIK
ncbi:MAG: T9SS type A sorting domain-containing protein [Candidatus Delongbacteria bacterium]|nr:T9SS type A sorting domain-containing protein [Candidatus Delongbacteria bacterium]